MPAGRIRSARWKRPAVGVGLPLLLGLLHVALVAGHYHVGSFDDDASYILTAKALLAGHGLTGHVASGQTVIGQYAPGYSALLVPLVWLWPHSFLPLRLLSVVGFAALFPLTWVLLGRRRLGFGLRVAVLTVLALGPPLATYGSMVMAEVPFLDALLLLLLALDRWVASPRVLSRWAVAVVGLAAGLIWLKEAGLGLIVGLFLWLLVGPVTRRLGRAATLAAGVGAALVPVVVARLVAGVALAGSRYTLELGTYYQGGLAHRLIHVLPVSARHLLSTAIPATLVPYLSPLPINHHWPDLWKTLSWHVTILAALGAVIWLRRYRDAAVVMVVVYLGEAALWPFVNERRAILVLPLLTAWYVLGAARLWVAARSWLDRRRARPAARTGLRVGAVIVAVAVVVAPLAAQMPRDYLYGWNQGGSRFAGSRYAKILARLGPPSSVVETDYRSSTALFTGHRTAWSAFIATQQYCFLPAILAALRQDRAGFLLLGDLNKPGVLDSPCLAAQARQAAWAVPLVHTRRDHASVYELIGPGTGHPALRDPTAEQVPTEVVTPAGATAVVTFPASPITQVSVGEAWIGGSPTPASVSRVRLQMETPDGRWRTLAAAPAAVGAGKVPYLVATVPGAPVAVAVRVVVRSSGPITATTPAVIRDLAVLGPA